MAAAPAEEIQRLEAAVKAQGDKVRDLKGNNASKEDVTAAVSVLQDLKKQLNQAKGLTEEAPKEKGKEKKKEGGEKGKEKEETAKEKRMRDRKAAAETVDASMTGPVKLMNELVATEQFGTYQIVRSEVRTERAFTPMSQLVAANVGKDIWIRGFVHNTRGKGGAAFILLRSGTLSAQVAFFSGEGGPSKDMIKFINGIPKESVVDIQGSIVAATVEKATQKEVEVRGLRIFIVSRAATLMPFQLEDAMQPGTGDEDQAVVEAMEAAGEQAVEETAADGSKFARVYQDTRLNNRWIDVRTPANQGIFRMQSATCHHFREFLESRGFTEIHTPKIIGAASEGGANVFKMGYFGGFAYLAQSPQLYKQMAIMGGLQRVFEIGPVFRAENSQTNRHLTEFVGLDIEMEITEHYQEVLDLLGEMFIHIFDALGGEKYRPLREAVGSQHPFEPLQYLRPTLILTFPEAVALLAEHGINHPPLEDLDTETEKKLGALVKEKYKTDFYILNKFPASARPFYTMVDPADSNYSNSYDIFLRGQEITSGSQRVHDSAMLAARAQGLGIDTTPIQPYIDSFSNGAPPHGGCGIGLERLVMLYLGLKNIRKTTMFPRDPKRTTP